MKKKLFKLILALFLLLLFAGGVMAVISLSSQEPLLSPAQEEVRRLYGLPQQFAIAYLPRGESQVVRQEVWIYPQHQKKVTFLAGELVDSLEFQPPQEVKTPTSLRPEDFEVSMNYQEVAAILGEENIEPLDFLPGFFDEGELQTYASAQAIFVIENDFLTYFQTVDYDSQTQDSQDQEMVIKEDVQEAQLLSYTSPFLGISFEYPADWYLPEDTDVLTSYDPDYLLRGEELPDKYLKCDYLTYRPEADVAISGEEILLENGLIIKKGSAVDVTDEDGPGLGDAVIFLVEADGGKTVSLLCYAYDDSFESRVLSMLSSVEFSQ